MDELETELKLPARAWRKFLRVIANPPPPNAKLVALMKGANTKPPSPGPHK